MANTRLLTNWIDSFLEYNENTESPKRFYLWSAISIISTLLGDRCWIDQTIFDVYPYMYIILVAESSVAKKSTAAKRSIKLYKELYTNPDRTIFIPEVFSGHISAASLSKNLGDMFKECNKSSLLLFSSELQQLIGPDFFSSGLESLMTALYDRDDDARWDTKTCGKDYYENPTVSLLGCTTFEHLQSIPAGFIERGFATRVIFVVDDSIGKPVAFPGDIKKQALLQGKLVHDLYSILEISGKFEWTKEGRIMYKKWYDKNYYHAADVDPRLKNYYGRKGTTALKIAMAVHVSKYNDTILFPEDIKTAIDYLEDVETNMATAFSGITMSNQTKHIDRIIVLLKRNGGRILRSKLHKDMSYYGSAKELMEGSIGTMIAAEMLKLDGKYYVLL